MRSRLKSVFVVFACMAIALMLGACGGGGGDNTPPPAHTLSGVAAAGAPIAGIVNVKGANGVTASSTIDTNGAFSLDVSGLTAPYILYAEGTVYGRSVRLYSAAVAAGSINITPITDFILRYALSGGDPGAAYSSWSGSEVTGSSLSGAESTVQDQLAPLLTAAGVSASADLMSDPFSPDGTGIDLVLESTSFAYNGTNATVTNELTGSTYTDDLASPSGSVGLPPTDEAATTAALSDDAGIDAVWQTIAALFATTTPTDGQIDAVVAPLVADDFLEDGEDKTRQIDDMKTGDALPVGITLSTSLIRAITPPGSYTKAYEIRLSYTLGAMSDSEVTVMVYDGANWLWYGNRHWLGYRVVPLAIMEVESTGTSTFHTALDVYMEDSVNAACPEHVYAYCNGVRSAIITGPGLPAGGLVLTHTYPNRELKIYSTSMSEYPLTDDTAIQAIPDNAEYTISLYAEPASSVTTSATPLDTGTVTIAKRPLLNAELNASVFPSVTAPTTHVLADAVIPGIQNVSWTSPAGTTVNQIYWNWSNSGTFYRASTEVGAGETSATLDTVGFPAPDAEADLYLSARDAYNRSWRVDWQFR